MILSNWNTGEPNNGAGLNEEDSSSWSERSAENGMTVRVLRHPWVPVRSRSCASGTDRSARHPSSSDRGHV